jgi:large subunit ribosomal protein L17
MRHNITRYQLARFSAWRKATVKSLVRAVLVSESIKTTLARAKASQGLVEKLITLGKKNDLTAKRLVYKVLSDHALVNRLFNEIAPRFKSVNGGYTRIIRLGNRRGDGAISVILELTNKKEKIKKQKAKDVAHAAGKKEDTAAATHEEKHSAPAESLKEQHKHAVQEKPKKFLGGIKQFFKQKKDNPG